MRVTEIPYLEGQEHDHHPEPAHGTHPAQQSVTLLSAIIAALVAGALGWALLALLARITTRARTIWTGIAAAVLVLSMVGPTGTETTTATTMALMSMHIVVGLILIGGLRRNAYNPGGQQ